MSIKNQLIEILQKYEFKQVGDSSFRREGEDLSFTFSLGDYSVYIEIDYCFIPLSIQEVDYREVESISNYTDTSTCCHTIKLYSHIGCTLVNMSIPYRH